MLKHTPEVRKQGVQAIKRHGSVRKASAATGVPKSTLQDWLRRNQPGDPGFVSGVDQHEVLRDEMDTLGAAPGQTDPAADTPEEITRRDAQAGEAYDTLQPEGTIHQHREDPLYLRAFRRYAILRANDVHPLFAMQAAQQVHPDFGFSPEEHDRFEQAMEQIQKRDGGTERLQMAALAPPSYVRSVYDQYAMDEAAIGELEAMLMDTYQAAFVQAINDQLHAIGRDDKAITRSTDPDVLARMKGDASKWSASIADNWNRDLAGQVGTNWISLSASRGNQMSRAWLDDEINAWVDGRADWKPMQIALTEATRAYIDAGMEFNRRNPDLGGKAYVAPGSAECPLCVAWVGMGVDDIAIIEGERVDHPGCPHRIVYVYDDNAVGGSIWTGGDAAAEAAA